MKTNDSLKIPIPKKYEVQYVFSDNINRIYFLLTDLNQFQTINNNTQFNMLFADIMNNQQFTYILNEMLSLDHNKKVTWEISSKSPNICLIFQFELIKNTLNDTTLVNFQITIKTMDMLCDMNESIMKYKQGLKSVCIEVIHSLENLLKSNNENIFDYESNVIECNIETVWDYITKEKGFLLGINIANINEEHAGTTIEYSLNMDELYKCKITKVKKNNNKKRWKYALMPLEGPFKQQEIQFILVRLGNDRTFFSIYHEFKQQIESDEKQELENHKKMMLYYIKQSLEKKK